MSENEDPNSPTFSGKLTKKKKTAPVKERYPWVEEADGLYYCKECKLIPALIRSIRFNNKDEFFITKRVAKNAEGRQKYLQTSVSSSVD